MKKKIVAFVLLGVLAQALLTFALFIMVVDVWIKPSPTGEYEIINIMIDEGGAGYDGVYCVKEKGLLSKWHVITTGTCSAYWISETEIEVYHSGYQGNHPNYVEGSYHLTRYSIDEFIKEE